MADKLVQDFVCDYYNDDVVFDGNDSDSIDALYVKQKRQAGVNLDNGLFANKPIESSSVGNFFKSAIASPVGLVATAGNNLAIIGQNVYDSLGERFKFLTEDELKRNKQIVENLNIQNQEIAENISEFFGADLDRISGKIGSGVGQSLSSLGFNAMGASPLMIALFGVNTAGENMALARESGRSATESVGRGSLAGYFEAKLENWGLQNLVKNITHNTVLKSITNSFKTEFIEEMSQNLSTDLIMKDITKKDWTSIITDALEAGVYGGISGGITGGAGSSINRLANTNLKKQIIDGIQEKAGRKLNKQELLAVDKVVNRADIKFDDAVKSATDSLNNDEEMRQAIIDTLNEQSDRLKYGNDFNYSNVTTRAKEIMEEIIAGKRQTEEQNHNKIVDIVENNSNLNKENKDRTVAMMEAFLLANEETFGKSVSDQLKDFENLRISSESEAISEPMDRLAFEDNDNTYVNEAGELVDKTTGQVLFQSAYAGSRVDYDRPSLEAIGSGEGAMMHGYGLYYALDKNIAERYRYTFTESESNKYYEDKLNDLYTSLIDKNEYGKASIIESLLIRHTDEDIKDMLSEGMITQKDVDWFRSIEDKYLDKSKKVGQVHEVDIPENPYLLDEQKPYSEQSDFVKNALKKMIQEHEDAGFGDTTAIIKEMIEQEPQYSTGEAIYSSLVHYFQDINKQFGVEENPQKKASELLNEYGIKGITYEGGIDGRCFVIFNPEDVKVLRKKFDELGNVLFQKEQQDIRGYVDVANKLVNILKTGNRDTVVHELNHLFSIYRIDLAIKNNKLDVLNPLFKHFNLEPTVENAEKLKNEEYYQEEIAKMSINYMAQHEAPSTGLRKYFEEFRQWAMSVWENLKKKGLVQEEELSQDVVDFFDSLYSLKEIDVESVAKAREQVRQLVKDIKAGKAVNIENINIDEVYRLLDAKNRRIPRAPKNLRQALVSAGGISNTLAESLDLKELMGEQDKKYSRLFTEKGKIKDENQLVEFLKSNGFMASEEAQTDTQVGSEFDRAMNLLENAENVYSEKDAQALAMRENTLQAVEEANQLLDSLGVDAEEVMQQIQELKKSDITAVSKSEVKQLDNKIKELEKEYKKLNKEVIKSTKENMQEMRDKVVDFIRAQKIDSEDKAKLITKVKQANTEYMLDKTLNEITEKAKEYYEKEQKDILSNAIEKELKKTKAKDVKNQKYLYEDNKLFNNLRNYSKMNQEQAEIELSKFMGKEDLTYDEQLEKLYLSYKANGKDDTSVDLMNELLDTIKYTKLQSKQAKDEKEFLDYLDRKENKDEMIHGVRTRKVTGGFEKGVARFVNGLNSMLRFVAGKDVAEKYNFENLETQKNIKTFNFYEAQAKESMDIFGFKKMGDLLNKIQEMRKKVATLSYYDEKLGQGKYDLTKMDIIDLYNDYKNADTKKAMDNIYGEAQITELIDMLTDEEKEFGDSLQKYVNERYEETNKVFVKAYQTDLPKIDNYWPRTSERTTNETDAFDTFKKPSETPSQLKERKKGNVIVKPMDAYSKFQNHIESSFYLTEMALPYKELSETINSMRVKNEITNKFDDKVYKDLKELVDNLSYSEYFAYRKKDLQSGMYDKILNNWVSAKIGGIAPTVFVKQLLSATNYATEMGYKNWAKGIFEYFKNPKQAKKFMEQYAGDYLKQRYKTGYNDAMSRVKEDAGNTPKVIPANIKNGLIDGITWMTRAGDISAIMVGGYPRLKQLINSGMSEEEAVKTWITETERAQQSRTMANQSRFQHNRTYRLISNFKNTPIQYMRKINDTIVGYMNGDISKDVATRTLFNYAVIQPVLLGMVTALMYNITAPDDKDKSYLDETIKALIMQFFNPVGGVSDVASAFVDTMQGNKVYDMQTPAFGEMVQAVKKLQKKKKDAFDYTEIMLPFIEATTGAPISRTEKQIKALIR